MLMKKIFTLIAVAFATLSLNATEIFKFQLNSDAPEVTVSAGEGYTIDGTYAYGTITLGGSITINNGHSSNASKMISGGKINLSGSGGNYVEVNLPSGVTLKAGDVIKLLGGTKGGGGISFADDQKISTDNMDANNEFTVPAGGDAMPRFFIWRGASKPQFTGILVERNENQVISPVISVADGKVVMTCATEGAEIYYATAAGVTTSTGTKYTAPIAITSTVTYYAIGVKEGMENSKEVSKAVEYVTIPTDATLEATLKAPSDIAPGGSDVALESLTDGTFTATKKESDAVLSNSAPYNNLDAFKGLVKVKKTIIITTTGEKNIAAIRVKGISNSDGNGQAVTATGMKFTTDSNVLPARDAVTEPGVVDLVAETPAKKFEVYFSGQARVMFEVYTTTATGILEVKKFEVSDGVIYNLAGQKVNENYKGVVIKDGKKMIQK